jgi:hypothetical protein
LLFFLLIICLNHSERGQKFAKREEGWGGQSSIGHGVLYGSWNANGRCWLRRLGGWSKGLLWALLVVVAVAVEVCC